MFVIFVLLHFVYEEIFFFLLLVYRRVWQNKQKILRLCMVDSFNNQHATTKKEG